MKAIALLAAALLSSGTASAAPLLAAGQTVAATLNGAAADLLGFDTASQAYVGVGTTTLTDSDIEYIAADFSFMLDLGSDGLLRMYDNMGAGLLDGLRVIELHFADPGLNLGSASLASMPAGGQVDWELLGPQSLRIRLQDVQVGAFGSLDLQLAAHTVPEPATIALASLGLLGVATSRRKTRRRS
jgi:hypothetical protein